MPTRAPPCHAPPRCPSPGDIAISSSGTIYFNTIQYGTGAYFYSLPVASLGAPGSSVSVPQVTSTTAEPLQISMGCDGTTLWGQRYDTCEWFTVNTATGAATKVRGGARVWRPVLGSARASRLQGAGLE
jgi:hypothetical protein